MTEIWKDIEGYVNYQVSSIGTIRRKTKTKGYKYLKKSVNPQSGYIQATLCSNGKCHVFKVHQLVAQAFIPNPENKPCIDHINTDRTDNRVENLRWVTHKENLNNPLSIINNIKAHRNFMKPVVQMTSDGYFKQIYRSQKHTALMNGKIYQSIYSYCKHKTNDPSGDKWELLENIDFMGNLPVVGRCSYIPFR